MPEAIQLSNSMKVACYTPVIGRNWFLRNCVLQMKAQTRRPDVHYLLINGADADSYDLSTIADLLDEKIVIQTYAHDSNNALLAPKCIKALLDNNFDLFLKVDSDDMYYVHYVETLLHHFQDHPQTDGLMVNLIDQFWLSLDTNGNAIVRNGAFHQGLGLNEHDIERGIKVGLPPTTAFDRTIAQLIVSNADTPRYAHITSDDILYREILIDNGIIIEQLSTEQPIFGYTVHDSNISKPG